MNHHLCEIHDTVRRNGQCPDCVAERIVETYDQSIESQWASDSRERFEAFQQSYLDGFLYSVVM